MDLDSAVRVRLLSFGPWRRLFPPDGAVRELPVGASVAMLLEQLATESVLSSQALAGAAVAVNEGFATRDRLLVDGDVVAVLPPVSGGLPEAVATHVVLTREVIEPEVVLRQIKAGGDGAVVVFDGIVRDNTRGRRTLHLDYEAYESMALTQLAELRAQALRRFAVREVAILHRLGRLLVGETSVLIVVASAHRGAAFEACQWVIDTLKKTVPIWKHEQFVDGALWVEGEPFPDHLTGAAEGGA